MRDYSHRSYTVGGLFYGQSGKTAGYRVRYPAFGPDEG